MSNMKPNEQDGYSLHDGSFISASAIQTADRETQLDAMRTWFFQNFEDPAESTPYDGGYVYIDGGPYDAHDELNTEFGGVVSDDVIKELEKELQQVSWEWAGIGQGDEELFLGVSSDHFNVFGH